MNYLVLLSSGIDSTVNLYQAKKVGSVALALTFDYGQRARVQEADRAQKMTQELGIPHQVIALPFFKQMATTSLLDKKKNVPRGNEVKIDDLKTSQATAKAVWVPNRNGIFLNIAAGIAEAMGVSVVVPGFNKEEASTFPDNSEPFMAAVTNALTFSTANKVRIECFTSGFSKTAIVKKGNELNVNWKNVWPCYQSLERWCGECESCQRAKRAFKANDVQIQPMFLK